ncbi:MAG: bifunctional serine/threonine-protein phosphatase/kinase [Hyphomicrobiales bacterium]|nr:bifunctional serine/threonine-protein phosphatase/kinase [Hyphomicrobiales bacterium]
MSASLALSIGQWSTVGRKTENQDFHGAMIPEEPARSTKGIAVALADGIGSSAFGRVAAEAAVKSFLSDYYCTAESWTVKTSATRVLRAVNSWLHAQSRRGPHAHDRDRGHVSTFDALIFKSRTLHLFHVGDAGVFRLSGRSLEALAEPHRMTLEGGEALLARALGADPEVEIDHREVPIDRGDCFLVATDGVWEHVAAAFVCEAVAAAGDDLDAAARAICEEALARGSGDNLTAQVIRIDAVPGGGAEEVLGGALDLPLPPTLEPRMLFEGYRILRTLHRSHRSQVHLAVDVETDEKVVLKTPSTEMAQDPDQLRRFAMEEWIARRVDSAHVVKPRPPSRRRGHLYVVMEFVEGQTLTQWMIDHPEPDLDTVRGLVEQIAKGLRAFHRKEMLHQDLRPENVMIDRDGVAKIIDFGSTRVAGVAESDPTMRGEAILGTVQYTAPEYFLGEPATNRSDIFSLGVIAHQMLTGRLPYGVAAAKVRSAADRNRLRYVSARDADGRVPLFVDRALARAVHPDPTKRPEALSEFLHDLQRPSPRDVAAARRPLIERDPVAFWRTVSFLLAAALVGEFAARRLGWL